MLHRDRDASISESHFQFSDKHWIKKRIVTESDPLYYSSNTAYAQTAGGYKTMDVQKDKMIAIVCSLPTHNSWSHEQNNG